MTKKVKTMLFLAYLLMSIQFISCDYISPNKDDFTITISENYRLFHAGMTSICEHDGTIIIDKNVVKVGWDQEFLIAEQQTDSTLNYWILDMNTNHKYSFIEYQEFIDMKTTLKINENIILQEPKQLEKIAD